MRRKILIMGAAGRDFHNFNCCFRDNENYEIVAFTATQIPDIEGRKYPASLAGKLYPEGIPIHAEEELEELIKKHNVDEVIFAYSDVMHEYVMHKAAQVNAIGCDFNMMGTKDTMIKSNKPVISICATRTGCGKSQTTRRVAEVLQSMGKKVVAIGETGLDYHYNFSEAEIQKEIFRAQLQIASELELPAIVHCREVLINFFCC